MNSESGKNDLVLSWDDIEQGCLNLAAALPKDRVWKGIIAVTTGGMIPACLVAKILGIKLIETFCISSYDHQDQSEAKIIREPQDCGDGDGWLVIDDLVDSGKTFEVIRKTLPKAYYACLYAKPLGTKQSDVFIGETEQTCWIHFPWEKVES